MKNFESFIEVMAYVSILFILVEVYLGVNKLWKRKHEDVVATSISLTGKFISLFPIAVFTLHAFIKGNWSQFLNYDILILYIVIQVAVGAGFWVEGKKTRNIFKLIRDSIRLEGREAGDLAKLVFKPSSPELVIEILCEVALIDGLIEEREKEYIESFAQHWDIKFSWEEVERKAKADTASGFDRIHERVREFLDLKPPYSQVKQLGDVIKLLVEIDEVVTDEEKLVLDELMGVIHNYTTKKGIGEPDFYVVVTIRSGPEESRIHELTPRLDQDVLKSGNIYTKGPFYSLRYAELMALKLQRQGLFACAMTAQMMDECR